MSQRGGKLRCRIAQVPLYCVYFYSAMLKIPNQLPNCLNRAETSVILSVFYGVLCDVRAAETSVVLSVFDDVLSDVHAYTVTVSVTWIRYQKSYIDIFVSARDCYVYITKFIKSMQFDCSNRTSAGYRYLSSLSFNRLSFEYY